MVVTREPEWDEHTRARTRALYDAEQGICRCGCGQPMELAHSNDPANQWYVDTYTCQAGRAIDMKRRQMQEGAENRNAPMGWDDGLHFYARPATDEDRRRLALKREGADAN